MSFSGGWEVCYAANLRSRIASRVLWKVADFSYRDEQGVYDAARAVEWPRLFAVERTLRVNVTAQKSPLKSLEFATLRIKDAVCDRFRDATGRRPDVERASPDVRVHAFLEAGRGTLYLDTSGEPLFKRGWRAGATEAPLRENLAAGIVMLTGWRPDEALLDPMCGGGTLLIEAAAMARGRAPGARRAFGFEKLAVFDPKVWESVQTQQGRSFQDPRLFGSDSDPKALAVFARFYPRLGDALKKNFAGWRCFIFTADLRLPKLIRLDPSARTPLWNGALECRLYEFEMVAGSRRRKPA